MPHGHALPLQHSVHPTVALLVPRELVAPQQASRRCASLSEVDRSIARYMFYFAVFNVFLGGVVGSTIIQGINSAITRGPSEIFTLIGTYLPTSSNFFINYTLFRCAHLPTGTDNPLPYLDDSSVRRQVVLPY